MNFNLWFLVLGLSIWLSSRDVLHLGWWSPPNRQLPVHRLVGIGDRVTFSMLSRGVFTIRQQFLQLCLLLLLFQLQICGHPGSQLLATSWACRLFPRSGIKIQLQWHGSHRATWCYHWLAIRTITPPRTDMHILPTEPCSNSSRVSTVRQPVLPPTR